MSTSLSENSIFAARYRVVRCIAAGGMGAIYEVVHLETERRRALKVMHPHFVSSPELRERFKSEARVAAKIDSDYIVDVFDAGVDDATQMPFLVMELLKGEELGKRLERQGRFSPTDTVNFLWQTALALDKTHKANIVHRDLKPENLFLNERDDGAPRVKVLDFGVAKFVADMGTQSNVTRSVGTPLYMAPEQFLGQNVGPGCDIYALAMMAYTMLVGEAYWTQEASSESTVFAFARHVQNGPMEAPSTRAARRGVALTFTFDQWFKKATSVSSSERYPSATATVAALGEVMGINPTRLVGVSASDPMAPNPSTSRPSGTELMGAGRMAVGQSGPVFTASQGISAAGVVAPVQPKSRAGAMAAVVIGILVIGGGIVAFSMRGSASHADGAAAASQVPAAEVAPASAAPTVAAPTVAAAAPAASASAAPSAEPAAQQTAEAAPSQAPAAAPVAAPRAVGRPAGKPAPLPAAKPAAPPAAAAPAAPAAKQPTYSRD